MEFLQEEIVDMKRVLIQHWTNYLQNWFPELSTKTYFVPPIHVNNLCVKEINPKEPKLKRQVATGNTEYRLDAIDSDFRDDRAQYLVVNSLWKLEPRHEVMVVLPRYELSHYMDKALAKALVGTTDTSVLFPVPKTCEDSTLRRGKFDVLIIHKQLGFIVIEVQAIGDTADTDDLIVIPKKLNKGLFKLDKLEKILKYLTSDMNVDIPITKTLALPNLDRERLKMIINEGSNATLLQSIQTCLCVHSAEEVLQLCICKDDTQDSNIPINDWWKHITEHMGTCRDTEDVVYRELIVRFCGPLSTVAVWTPGPKRCRKSGEVRSISEAIERMGALYTMRILRREQIDVIDCDDKHLFLTGPPGAGKTLILLAKAVRWIRNGDTVILLRGPGNNPGHFISHVLHKHILKSLAFYDLQGDKIHLKTIDAFTDPTDCVFSLLTEYKRPGKHVRILIDEMWAVNLLGKMKPLIPDVQKSLEAASAVLDTMLTSCQELNLQQHASSSESVTHGVVKSIMDTLYDTNAILTRMDSVKGVAKSLFVPEVRKMLNIVGDGVNKLTQQMDTLATHGIPDLAADQKKLNDILETIQDTRFYARVILSWLASHVLLEITQVVRRQPHGISLWCTGFWRDRCPNGYTLNVLEHSVRCPPHVQQILAMTENLASHRDFMLYKYITKSTDIIPPLPAEGAVFQEINHWDHVPDGGNLTEICDCKACGEELADLLINKLKIGKDRLHFRDVLIVSRPLLPLKETSVFISTLKNKEIPIFIMTEKSEEIGEVDVDKIVVTNTFNGHGLERPVVVFVPVTSKCDLSGRVLSPKAAAQEGGGSAAADYVTEFTSSEETQVPATDSIDTGCDLRWFESLGRYNQRGLFFVASRSVADLIIIKVQKESEVRKVLQTSLYSKSEAVHN